jgi:hypothetical protein
MNLLDVLCNYYRSFLLCVARKSNDKISSRNGCVRIWNKAGQGIGCSDRSIALYDLRMGTPLRKLIMQVHTLCSL